MIRTETASNKDRAIMNRRIGEAQAAGDIAEVRRLIAQAQEQGINLSERSIDTPAKKASGQITGVPKDMRQEVQRIIKLFD